MIYIQENLTITPYPIEGITWELSDPQLIEKFEQLRGLSKLVFNIEKTQIVDIVENEETKLKIEQKKIQEEQERKEKENKEQFHKNTKINDISSLMNFLSKKLLSQNIALFSNDDDKIQIAGLFEEWVEGKYEIGDIRNANNQTWECFQAHDNSIYPDIKPDNPSWYTFWRPLHGTTPETARAWVAPQGAHDIYKVGEYMWFTDYKLYKCIQQTNFSPTDYPMGWEVQE